jgi:hypothetical protein
MNSNSKLYIENGLTVLKGVISPDIIRNLRQEIVDVISEISIEDVNYNGTEESFVKETTKSLWKVVNNNPKKRNLVYKYIQRVPSLYQLAGLNVLKDFAKSVGVTKPSIREFKVQMYMPWEKLFFQCCHQDINSLDSDNSVTFWIPLHLVSEKSAVSYHKHSHKEGPIKHEEFVDEENGIYNACVPEKIKDKYPIIEKAIVDAGDLIALNRTVFHKSPKFEDQKWSRWTVVIRYDDIYDNGLYENTTKFEDLTPFSLKRYNEEIIPSIKRILNEKPKIKWSE